MGAGGNVHATLRFADGSVGTISYLTDGSSRFPKETLDLVGDGRNGRLDNFQRVTVWSATGKGGHRVLAGQDKGQRAQLERFVNAVHTGSAMPIPVESLAATTPCPIEFVGVKDTFGASGEPEELANHFGISAPFIADAAQRVIHRKRAFGAMRVIK